jgi:hypothetical protein
MNVYALTTLARLKAFIGIDVTTYDSVLEVIIDSVTDFIENECGRRLKKTAYTGTVLNGEGKSSVVLPQWPIVSGETLTIYERDAVNYGNDNWDTISSDKYRVDEEAGIVNFNFRLSNGFQNYKIDYTAGYDFENVTGTLKTLASVGLADLELVVWKLCGRAYNERKSGGNIASMRLYNYSVSFSKEAYSDDEIKEVLNKYKRFTF